MIGLLELEIFVFGCSAIAYIESISNNVNHMKEKIAVMANTIALCPNCPHVEK